MVKGIVVLRHADREDRAYERAGKEWITTALRPQDPKLSERGRIQAANVGNRLKTFGISKILCSPTIRAVQTADIVAEQLGMGENSICVEPGLVEEAKSFRGKCLPEPRPNWNPLILSASDLQEYSRRINLNYVPLVNVEFAYDTSLPNTVREVHPSLEDRDAITWDRVRTILDRVKSSEDYDNETVLCVGHYATVKMASKLLGNAVTEDLKHSGYHSVGCFAHFRPTDPNNKSGTWESTYYKTI